LTMLRLIISPLRTVHITLRRRCQSLVRLQASRFGSEQNQENKEPEEPTEHEDEIIENIVLKGQEDSLLSEEEKQFLAGDGQLLKEGEIMKVQEEIIEVSDDEEKKSGEAKLVELEHPYKDSRYFLLGVPFTDVQSVEEVVNDLKPDYILVSYDQDRMDRICDLNRRRPQKLRNYIDAIKPTNHQLRGVYDTMIYALMCGHHHLDPALEYCKENNKPIYAVDRSEFLTTFRAKTGTINRLPKLISTGKTVKMLTPYLHGSLKSQDMTQEFLEDARESLDSEDVDFERLQLMKLPAFGSERGEIFAHRMFYFQVEPGSKVLGIVQRSLFEHVLPEWGKTTDEDMHHLHLGPSKARRTRAIAVGMLSGAMLYSLPFYIASMYLDPTLMGIMWASIPTFISISYPMKMFRLGGNSRKFHDKVQQLDAENGLSDRWREDKADERWLGPEEIEAPGVKKEMGEPNPRFSPKNFGVRTPDGVTEAEYREKRQAAATEYYSQEAEANRMEEMAASEKAQATKSA